jgi:hypothetical protein
MQEQVRLQVGDAVRPKTSPVSRPGDSSRFRRQQPRVVKTKLSNTSNHTWTIVHHRRTMYIFEGVRKERSRVCDGLCHVAPLRMMNVPRPTTLYCNHPGSNMSTVGTLLYSR